VENLNFSEKYDTDPGTLPPGYFCTQTFKKRFNVRPFDITADRSGKNKFQCFSVFSSDYNAFRGGLWNVHPQIRYNQKFLIITDSGESCDCFLITTENRGGAQRATEFYCVFSAVLCGSSVALCGSSVPSVVFKGCLSDSGLP